MKKLVISLLLCLSVLWLFGQVLVTESFDSTTFPPTGWTATAISGTYNWVQAAAGTYPAATPHTGAGFARYNSFTASAGNSADLAAPSFPVATGFTYSVTFWMYKDDGYLTNADRVEVYANSSGASAGGTLVGTVNRSINLAPVETANGWYNFMFEFTPVGTGSSYIILKAVSAYGNDIYVDDVAITRSSSTAPPNPAILVSPANNATNVMTSATLNWTTGGGGPTDYNVYFGTSPTPPLAINQTGTSYTPAPALVFNTTYYWKIVPHNSFGNAINCPTWTFTTGGPVINMTNGTQTVADGASFSFYDSGGPGAPYQNSENYTFTFTAATPGSSLQANFTAFDTESGYDYLKIYDGPNTTFPQIGPAIGYNGTVGPGQFDASGSITFVYTTDTSVTHAGWEATIMAMPSVANDLQAVSITGSSTPSVAMAFPYIVTVRNRGSSPQTNYQVKIFSGASELATVNGPVLAPGEVAPVTVNWTPTNTGPMQIHGTVVLASDQVAVNNNTPDISVNVQPAGTLVTIIGTGTSTQSYPFYTGWGYTRSASLYASTETGLVGAINSLEWYVGTVSTTVVPYRIYLKTTTDNALPLVPWDTMTADATLMQEGTFTFSNTGWALFNFTVPFVYPGGNLVVMVETYYGGTGTGSPYFQYTTSAAGSHEYWYQDNTPPTGNGYASTSRPNIGLFFTALNPFPTFAVSPQSWSFGPTYINTTLNKTFTIANVGSGATPLGINSITISGSPFFTLQSLPTLPASLASFQTTSFVCRYIPTAAGTQNATITITDNLTRTQHAIALTGNSVDPTIYTSPYVQNFDTVTVPNFPIDWTPVAVSPATVTTVTTSPHSSPNCVSLYNSSVTAGPFLIGPPVSTTLPITTMRARFWAKGGTNYTMSVGILSNPNDTGTYTECGTVTTTASWAEYAVSFQTYLGTGTYVAFKHGDAATYQTIYIDDVTIEVISANDLAAMAISGDAVPVVGSPSVYTIDLFNWGTAAQATYQVKLFNSSNVELASAAGPFIDTNSSAQATVTWTPTTAGVQTIYGKVVLAGDQNSQNNQTPNKTVAVQAPGTIIFTVGDGSSTANYMPFDMFYHNSLFETIYQSEEMTAGGLLTTVAFYNNFVTNLPNMPTKIWLGTTQSTALDTGWVPSTDMTLVYDGNVDYPSGANTIIIPLQNPFPFAGGNLIMLCNRPMDTVYYNSADVFLTQTVGTNRSRYIYNDTTVFDPTAPPAGQGTVTGMFPKTTFFFSATGPNTLAISPPSHNFGQHYINTTTNKLFNIMNIGNGPTPLVVSSISLTGSPFFTLQGLPTLPLSLNTAQAASFTVVYHPTAAGTHTATLVINDNTTARSYRVQISSAMGNSRLVHNVDLSAIAVDPTIYTSPYVQNFDTVTQPAFPIDWTPIAVSPATVTTSTTSPHSTPNCAYLYNSSSIAGPILIGPPISTTLPIQTMRMRFWAKGGSTTTHALVGIVSDPANAASFTQVGDVTLTTGWAEYAVGFQTYLGNGNYMAIKHGGTATYQSVYIDDVTIEVMSPNDLAAISITGDTVIPFGTAATYSIGLFNWGTASQSNYQVKLYNSSNVELASVAGPNIDPGMAATATINWTPTTSGSMTIYGKVVLTGDANNTNDQTVNKSILVLAAGTFSFTVGDGSSSSNLMPVDMYYHNSLFETIYQSDEMLGAGNISMVSFYNNFITNLPNMPTKVWLGTTDQADLSTGWIPSTSLTLVYDGNVDYPSGQNTIVVPLQNEFFYPGGNLVMMVNRPMDVQYYSSSDVFFTQTVGTNRSLNIYNDTTLFDPAAPPAGATNSGQFPKTTFYVTPVGTVPIFHVTPATFSYGTRIINTSNNKSFTIMNIGGGASPLIINSITISGSPFFTLQSLPTLPVSLNTAQQATFTLNYTPTTPGDHAATIVITDNLSRSTTLRVTSSRDAKPVDKSQVDTRTQHSIPITASCIDPQIYTLPYTQNFDAVTIPALPLDWGKLATAPATVTTVTTAPNSNPNCVSISNSTVTSGPYLVAPPLVSTLNLNTTRIRFWAKGAAGYTLSVGIMANPLDTATFVQTSTVTLTGTWAEYIAGFQTYAGTGRFIALKHGNAATYQTIYVDDANIETIPANDLAALSVSGNSTPSVGAGTPYTVNVFNWGTVVQNTYQVKLFTAGDIEVASVAGPSVNPGMTAPVIVTWTPTTTGPTTLYGKVVLAGDQIPANDISPSMNVEVFPAGSTVLTVGDNTSTLTQRQPFGMFYGYERDATLITQAQLSNTIGMITGLQWYVSQSAVTTAPIAIYIKPTTMTTMTAATWSDLTTGATLVREDNVAFSATGWHSFTFTDPYMYLTGGNLLILVETNYGGSGTSPYPYFKYTNGDAGCHQYWQQDGSAPTGNGSLNTYRPNIGFIMIPGNVGHLTGTVLGTGNLPLQGATIQILGNGSATTDAQGHYTIMNIIEGDYQVTCSSHGYISQTVPVTIVDDITLTQDFTLQQMPTVTLSGTIVGSDNTSVGLAGATIAFTGYENYSATANTSGYFSIDGVYANQTYNYVATAVGYQTATSTVAVGATNHDMGNVILSEIAYTPRNVVATQATDHTTVSLAWLAPDPNALDFTQSFENAGFPPTDWTRTVTNNDPAYPNGVFPTWCRFGQVTDGTTVVNPSSGSWQAGLWGSYNHQDEKLTSPLFNCPQGASLSFDSYYYKGSGGGDHYYVEVSANNGTSWTTLWDASALTGGYSNYAAPIVLDLNAYAGQQIKVAWHALSAANDGMWYVWAIDNVIISTAARSLKFNETDMVLKSSDGRSAKLADTTLQDNPHATRIIEGYKVWRFTQGQEQNEGAWVSLTPTMITALTLTDTGWGVLPSGTYKWAIKAVYTGNVLSLGVFSNTVVREATPTGTLTGVVRNLSTNQAVPGAVITAGIYTATTGTNGSYNMTLPTGTYTVSCNAAGYQVASQPNVVINANQTTTQNFSLTTGNAEETEVTVTTLKNNYPNPFTSMTTIAYDLKAKAPVKIDIYNTKGQLIRTLVNTVINKGHQSITWDGRDANGKPVASGVYQYRMQAGSFQSNRLMMLMK